MIQLQPQQQQQPAAAQPGMAGAPGGIQIVQQIITPTGEIHQIPIQLNAQQLQVKYSKQKQKKERKYFQEKNKKSYFPR